MTLHKRRASKEATLRRDLEKLTQAVLDMPTPLAVRALRRMERAAVAATKSAREKHADTGWARALEGMALAAANVPEWWVEEAHTALHSVCLSHEEFTVERVWECLARHGSPGAADTSRYGSALGGAVMKSQRAREWCFTTSDYERLERPSAHVKPVPVWRSKIYMQEEGEPTAPPPKRRARRQT